MSIVAHPDRGFDLDDLFDLPDDGLRYEVLDGALVVNAAPVPAHQRAVLRLATALGAALSDDLEVLLAPAWHIGAGQVPEPDLVVVERARVGPRAVDGTPLLVVEVLSTNRGMDLVRKRELYATAGCPWYWLVDPSDASIVVLHLEGGSYTETEAHHGPGVVRPTAPLAVEVSLDGIA